MFCRLTMTLFFLALLVSCAPSNDLDDPTFESPSNESTALPLISPASEISPSPSLPPQSTLSRTAEFIEEDQEDPFSPKLTVWCLGGNGWAVEQGDRLMIFDYVESTDPNPPAAGEVRDLGRGYIDVEEIKEHEAYVFVTHSHPDHYDPVIYEWQETIDEIRYVFGWAAGENPEYHYLVGPRAEAEVGDLRVNTINSHHADVPEVAYLVESEGIWIYHNGDYMATYEEDFEYLKTFSDHVDIAFLIGWPYPDHQQFQQAMLFTELFTPEVIFASCREGDEGRCQQFAEMLADRGVEVSVQYAPSRGQAFEVSLSVTE